MAAGRAAGWGTVTAETALANAREVVALWRVGRRDCGDVIRAACDLLVAGYDGEALRTLAGVSIRYPGSEVSAVLPDALRELGIDANDADPLIAVAAVCLRGELTPRELAKWAFETYDYDHELAHTLAELDDVYFERECTDYTEKDVDAMVTAEARRLVELQRPPARGAAPRRAT
jgi:hypothetical protein